MKLKSNQLETKYTCAVSYDLFNFNAKLVFLPQFHGQLNTENDSASGASVYYGHILVRLCFSSTSYVLIPFFPYISIKIVKISIIIKIHYLTHQLYLHSNKIQR